MTTRQARNLLRRKKLKGAEIGQALLLSFINDYEQWGSATHTPLFTQQELHQMVALLPSEYERGIYADYVELHDSIVALFRQAQGMEQQLHNGLYFLVSRLSLACKLQLLSEEMDKLRTLETTGVLEDTASTVSNLFAADSFAGLLESPDALEELASARDGLTLPSYIWLTGYNAMLTAYAEGLDLRELEKLRIPLEVFLAQGESIDALRADCAGHLPPEVCPPLQLSRIVPDEALLRGRAALLQKSGPGGMPPLDTLQLAMDAWREML